MNDDQMREEFEAVVKPMSEADRWAAWPIWQAACQAQAKRDAEICRTPEVLDDDGTGYKQYLIRSAETCAQEIEKEAGL